jgi:hypothetical protein
LHLICEELLGFPLNQTTRKERWILKYTLWLIIPLLSSCSSTWLLPVWHWLKASCMYFEAPKVNMSDLTKIWLTWLNKNLSWNYRGVKQKICKVVWTTRLTWKNTNWFGRL